ncbi:hypothetical protein RJ639_017704 [Escallonia herrerae]|uniref:DDB1- and CUL4-associated factor 8 n=1 Tax=Escallonia herrerae TaxID=1293975 RepID=A0AA88VFY4_9ASTE|nr:hypothetical protein RJ639_017704 [Escallonia herrerae]
MRKRPRTSLDTAIVDVWKREVGELSTRKFSHRLGASEDLVLRLELFRKLEKHRGCVNAVSFNADGEILVSGSDDRRVTLWDWQTGRVKLSFHSGHSNNVFQAKIMPYTEDRTIVTCAADGQNPRFTPYSTLVLHPRLPDGDGDAMYAVEKPDKVDLNKQRLSKWLNCTLTNELLKCPVVVNGSNNRDNSDQEEEKVRCAQIPERGQVETKLLGKHQGRVHKLAIEPGSPYIFYTCGEDGVVQHFDLRTGAARELFTCYSVDDTRRMPINLYTIAIDPRNPNMFVVAGSDAYARLYDIRKHQWDGSADLDQPTDYFCPPHLIGDEYVGITGLAFSNYSELLVSYNDESIYLFTRDMGLGSNPTSASLTSIDSEMKADQNSVNSAADADAKVSPRVYKGHKNCKTVKGVNFFGPKCEYVVSGSDCGRIFIWKKNSGELVRVMEADEHVVNCIECHPHTTLLASSGLEHDIKIWTPKAIERAVMPVDIEKLKPKARGWMYHMASPEDLMWQLVSLRRPRTSPEHGGESLSAGRELLEFLLTYGANSDGSSEDGGDRPSAEDHFN